MVSHRIRILAIDKFRSDTGWRLSERCLESGGYLVGVWRVKTLNFFDSILVDPPSNFLDPLPAIINK